MAGPGCSNHNPVDSVVCVIHSLNKVGKKVKSAFGPSGLLGRRLSPGGFCGMKRLGVFLLPPGWDASPWQGYPQH